LVRTHKGGFHPGYWSFVDKQIMLFSVFSFNRASPRGRGKPSIFMILPVDQSMPVVQPVKSPVVCNKATGLLSSTC